MAMKFKQVFIFGVFFGVLVFSGAVVIKVAAINSTQNTVMASSPEALSASETDVSKLYQSMGYCDGILTFKCITPYTSEKCRRWVCTDQDN